MAKTAKTAKPAKKPQPRRQPKLRSRRQRGAGARRCGCCPHLAREQLPIPDAKHVGLTTYDAKDPNTKYPPIKELRPPEGGAQCVDRVDR